MIAFCGPESVEFEWRVVKRMSNKNNFGRIAVTNAAFFVRPEGC